MFRGQPGGHGGKRFSAQIVRGIARAASLFVIGAAALLVPGADAYAQVQRSFINTSFEEPVLPSNNCWSIRESHLVPGWETTEPTFNGAWGTSTHGTCGGHKAAPPIEGPIQMFRNDAGIVAPDGDQWAELNAYSGRRLYQEVCLVDGEQVQWSLFHRGRLNTDLFRFNIGTQSQRGRRHDDFRRPDDDGRHRGYRRDRPGHGQCGKPGRRHHLGAVFGHVHLEPGRRDHDRVPVARKRQFGKYSR